MLTHNQIRTAGGRFICTLGVFSILEQHLRCKSRDAVSTNASDNVAACDACGKYFGLRHSEIAMRRVAEKASLGDLSFFALRYLSSRVRFDRLFAQKTIEAPAAIIDVRIEAIFAPMRSHSSIFDLRCILGTMVLATVLVEGITVYV